MKAKKATRSVRARTAARARHARRPSWIVDPRAVVIGLMFAAGTAVLIAARQPSRPTDIALAAQPAVRTPSAQQPPATAPRPDTKKAVATKPVTTHVPPTLSASAATATAGEPVLDSTPTASAVPSTPATAVENVASVTITGCLEHDAEAFWLSDTTGVDTPTSRSWKSGFLKKRPSRIALVDTANALRLPSYVGQRVTASGTLVNREMKTRSLHRVSSSCS